MELKIFSRNDCKYRNNGHPTFKVEKNGVIKLSKEAKEAIGLKEGDKILIVQDQQRPKDWYITKTKDEQGFVLRKSMNHLAFNAKTIALEIYKSLELPVKTTTFRMATEPTEKVYYAIITKSVTKSTPEKQ